MIIFLRIIQAFIVSACVGLCIAGTMVNNILWAATTGATAAFGILLNWRFVGGCDE